MTFPVSYLELNLAKAEASKIRRKAALRLGPVALRLGPFWSGSQNSPILTMNLIYSLLIDDFIDVIDDMACKCNGKTVLEGRFIS